MPAKNIVDLLKEHADEFHPVVPFDAKDKLLFLAFTEKNLELNAEILENTNLFIKYINSKLEAAGARYGIGGYGEHRTIYSRSKVFDGAYGGEARRLHLGIDIWGKPYTKVMSPLDGIVHSFAFNNAFGDYGATIILTHNLEGETFHTLYGHLSLNSIKNIQEGDRIKKGDVFTEFGIPFENGQWPPHLHFQLVIDMEGKKGDYPGVCKFSEREKYLANCPDPDLILQMMQYVARS
ncbi:MAG TPA: peptidoglycan DD-metalloendopeptidase family protein [Flavisolibacter sp.]|nr:peptidoglycan DD-metalloendopeptidase family protein [Flavisolibacter sp.]